MKQRKKYIPALMKVVIIISIMWIVSLFLIVNKHLLPLEELLKRSAMANRKMTFVINSHSDAGHAGSRKTSINKVEHFMKNESFLTLRGRKGHLNVGKRKDESVKNAVKLDEKVVHNADRKILPNRTGFVAKEVEMIEKYLWPLEKRYNFSLPGWYFVKFS